MELIIIIFFNSILIVLAEDFEDPIYNKCPNNATRHLQL